MHLARSERDVFFQNHHKDKAFNSSFRNYPSVWATFHSRSDMGWGMATVLGEATAKLPPLFQTQKGATRK